MPGIIEKINKKTRVLLTPGVRHAFEADWFETQYWLNQGRLLGANTGRGSAWTVKSELGKWVLRHYYRGGLYARLNRDLYLFTGWTQSRSFEEFRVLEKLAELDLPAPRPVAARVVRKGLWYRADLLMSHVPHQSTWAARLREQAGELDLWRRVGECIARFHRAGIHHSDLNAHNILIDDAQITLIDFDKARLMSTAGAWQQRNLKRLRRSIEKVTQASCRHQLADGWAALHSAYSAELGQ